MKPLRRLLRSLKLGFQIGLLLMLLSLLFSAGQVYYYSRATATEPADAALVLGAATWDKRPSPVFRERLNHAVELYRSRRVGKLILTGGTPKPGFMTEAEVGRRYALQQGVPAEALLYENTSRDTYQNLVNAKKVAADNDIGSVILVSDPYHMARALAMARDLGFKAQASPTPTSRYNEADWKARARFAAQESYALAVYHWVENSQAALRRLRNLR